MAHQGCPVLLHRDFPVEKPVPLAQLSRVYGSLSRLGWKSGLPAASWAYLGVDARAAPGESRPFCALSVCLFDHPETGEPRRRITLPAIKALWLMGELARALDAYATQCCACSQCLELRDWLRQHILHPLDARWAQVMVYWQQSDQDSIT